ncbi:orotidine-5'-phosphate decarboxylase [Feifania hominis]|uniref:Orotidine 5'-phosphate decarboxylase n=1 Tax=Feifania hominis TaxID=2763660 RepID=A0A926HPB8_9FIRM|nr:orotidine-5'-phosphate decarboxylase [Feifania hominis]MBC8535112.1 orotidine-5'-phosphate decarboxylase [Feifania hominis]
MSVDKLCEKIIERQNPSVVGLDPVLSYIPQAIKDEMRAAHQNPFEAAAQSLLAFNQAIIDEIADVVPAVKPQIAFYEMYGWQGVRAYHETVEYAKKRGLYVIGDIKRGDIGSTAEAYAIGHMGRPDLFGEARAAFDTDAVTVNPYLGSDGILPFARLCKGKKMIFVLAKTSNQSSGEYQDQVTTSGETIYQLAASNMERLGESHMGACGYSDVGIVVGATYPAMLGELRERVPHTFFLVPGYGAQGGGGADAAPAFDSRGLGAIVNSSRGIICAWQKGGSDGRDFAKAAREAAIRMREDLLGVLGGKIG